MNEIFEGIYAKNRWKHGSGEGSLIIHTKGYVAFLEQFLKERHIQSVVDMGCGDWQFSRNIQWGTAHYQGFDVVSSVIDNNRREFGTDEIEFHLYSGNPAELPSSDLLIVKDVLQHLSNQSVAAFLPALARYKYALLTNCVNPRGPTRNKDIAEGGFRYLDLRLSPFHLEASELYSFTNTRSPIADLLHWSRWLKRVLLVERGAATRSAEG